MLPGTELPSVRALATRYDWPASAVRRAVEVLVTEGVLLARPGRSAVVSGVPVETVRGVQRVQQLSRTDVAHDCARSGCKQHSCNPMSARVRIAAPVICGV
jgi:DNA-binding GntR family transcriptional regulator